VLFEFGRDYMEYLDAKTEAAQRELISDVQKEVFVYMHASSWFNLQSPEGRQMALCHVLALVRWHDAPEGGVKDNRDQSSKDEEQDYNNDGSHMENEEEHNSDGIDMEDEEEYDTDDIIEDEE